MFVGSLLESEAERHAENQLKEAAQDIYNISGNISQLVVKKGDIQTEILSVLRDNPDITVLVAAPPQAEALCPTLYVPSITRATRTCPFP